MWLESPSKRRQRLFHSEPACELQARAGVRRENLAAVRDQAVPSPSEGCAYSAVSGGCRMFASHYGLNVRMRRVGALLRGDVLKGKRVRSASAHTHTHTCKSTYVYLPKVNAVFTFLCKCCMYQLLHIHVCMYHGTHIHIHIMT